MLPRAIWQRRFRSRQYPPAPNPRLSKALIQAMLECIRCSTCQLRHDGHTASPTRRPPIPRAAGSASSGATAYAGNQSCNRCSGRTLRLGLPGAVRGKSHPVSVAASNAPGAACFATSRSNLTRVTDVATDSDSGNSGDSVSNTAKSLANHLLQLYGPQPR